MTTRSTSLLSARLHAGGRDNPRMDRPVRTRDDRTYLTKQVKIMNIFVGSGQNVPLPSWQVDPFQSEVLHL